MLVASGMVSRNFDLKSEIGLRIWTNHPKNEWGHFKPTIPYKVILAALYNGTRCFESLSGRVGKLDRKKVQHNRLTPRRYLVDL